MNTEKYAEQVKAFNAASGAKYSSAINFLSFRKTRRGILVGHYAGRQEEVAELKRNVARAGAPYYTK